MHDKYNNLSISEDDKKDPIKLLDVFECYFKPEHNSFQSWCALSSIKSGAFKTQSKFYHKLNSVANDCNFTNKDEVVKFLYLTNNQNTRVREHLLKELTDTTSLADMLRMAHVCEGTVHSEEISKQYLESVKTVNRLMPYIRETTISLYIKVEAMEAIGFTAGLNQEGLVVVVQIVVPVTHLRNVRHTAKNVFTATRKDILVSFVIQSNVESLLDPM